jgi:hypothetical protein
MSLHMALIAALASTAAVSGLHTTSQEPSGVARQQRSIVHERVAEDKKSNSVPGALPGRSESSEEAGPKSRAAKKAKPADGAKDGKRKDKAREGGKKDPQ